MIYGLYILQRENNTRNSDHEYTQQTKSPKSDFKSLWHNNGTKPKIVSFHSERISLVRVYHQTIQLYEKALMTF